MRLCLGKNWLKANFRWYHIFHELHCDATSSINLISKGHRAAVMDECKISTANIMEKYYPIHISIKYQNVTIMIMVNALHELIFKQNLSMKHWQFQIANFGLKKNYSMLCFVEWIKNIAGNSTFCHAMICNYRPCVASICCNDHLVKRVWYTGEASRTQLHVI